jgi:hypothetical protein
MSRPFFSVSDIKTVFQGALGAMTFGAYHQFTTNKMMEMNNQILENKHKSELDKLEMNHKEEMKILIERLDKLENSKSKSWW